MRTRTDRRSLETMDLNALGSHQTHRGHVTGSSGVESRMRVRVVSALIHAAANFASFLRLRELSINESTFCRMVWKEQRLCRNVVRHLALLANRRWCVARRRSTRQQRAI